MVICWIPDLATVGQWRNKRKGSGHWNTETETTVWRQCLKGALIFGTATEPAWHDFARRELGE